MKDVKHFESLYPLESRERELHEIVEYIKEGNSMQVVGLPGAGRSTVLQLLAHNKAVREKHFPKKLAFVHFVLVNFAELHNRPLIDVTKLMFLNLIDSLRDRDMHEEYEVTNTMFRESLSMGDELVIFQGLKRAIEYLSVEKKLTLIFLMDRFEEYIPMLTPAFFSNLRVLRNLAKYRFSVVFTTYKPLEDIVEASMLYDYHDLVAGHLVYLSVRDEPSLHFRIDYLEQLTEKKLSPEVLSELLTLTGGHWKLLRLSAEALLSGDNPTDIVSFLLQKKTIVSACEEILEAFTPAELQALQSGTPVDESMRSYFESIDIMKSGELSIPLLADFLKANTSKTLDSITFNPERNSIQKGELVLSDSLTAAEFRLLAYLIQHQDRVIDRDEIIDVVWKEEKSTAGVTDQAVDQLLFRLRRKIENDPNNPQHIKTVKGRGYSFTP